MGLVIPPSRQAQGAPTQNIKNNKKISNAHTNGAQQQACIQPPLQTNDKQGDTQQQAQTQSPRSESDTTKDTQPQLSAANAHGEMLVRIARQRTAEAEARALE